MFLGIYETEEDILQRLEENIVSMVYVFFGYDILDEIIIKRELTTNRGMRILLRSKTENILIYISTIGEDFYKVKFDLIHSTNSGELINRLLGIDCKEVLDTIQSILKAIYDRYREPWLVVLLRRIQNVFRKRKPKDADIS